MKSFCVKDETAPLKAVIVGRATSNGPTPSIDEAYDPKSIEHLKAGTYPVEADMIREIEGLAEKLKSFIDFTQLMSAGEGQGNGR